jgi:tRNA threonylcarbamoyladenosine biosynthesis protein TsaE
MKINIKDKRYLATASKKIVKYAGDRRVIAFYGSMGAGKTTIIKSICKVLGAADITSSPTFTIVNEYRTAGNESLYHIDFYRILKSEEIYDIGIGEYLSGDSWCFLEWPELAEEILPPETVKIRITVGSGEHRILDLV